MGRRSKQTCSWEECNLTCSGGSRWCYKHTPGSRKNVTIKCDAHDCDRLREARGKYCCKHKKRLQKWGDINIVKRRMSKPGSVRHVVCTTLYMGEIEKLNVLAEEAEMTRSEWIRTVVLDEMKEYEE